MDDQPTPIPCEPGPNADDAPTQRDAGGWRMPSHRVLFCKIESCQPDGGGELARLLEERLGVKVDERVYDGSISLEALECVGLCDIRQAALIDDAPFMGLPSVMRAVDALLEED